ncbi:hypothetical protein GCM10027020_17260 [Nocardioides salsibiostraticola]
MSEQPPEWRGPENPEQNYQQNPAPYGAPAYGAPAYQSGGYGPPPSDGSATVALVLGILSIVLCGFLTGIPAMIMGRNAKKRIQASGGQLGGEGLATAGFWTGLVGTVLSVLGFLAIVALFALGSSVQTSFEESCDTIITDPNQFAQC